MIAQVCASGGLKRESIRGELNESRYRAGIPGSPGSSPQSGSAGEPSSHRTRTSAVLDSAKRLKTAKLLFPARQWWPSDYPGAPSAFPTRMGYAGSSPAIHVASRPSATLAKSRIMESV